MTDFPQDLFAQVYKRAPNDSDRDRLMAVKATLGLSSRDEMWPILMVLDHYDRTIRAGRAATAKEVKELLQDMKAISEKAGPIAEAEAQKAIQKLISDASDKIAKASAEKSITTADRMSKRQMMIAGIAGAIIATVIALTTAWAVYATLNRHGICSEAPVVQDGIEYCLIDRSEN